MIDECDHADDVRECPICTEDADAEDWTLWSGDEVET